MRLLKMIEIEEEILEEIREEDLFRKSSLTPTEVSFIISSDFASKFFDLKK